MEEKVLLQSNCSLYRVTTKEELDSFSCGDEDLDDFFHQEACLYDGQLLGKHISLPRKEVVRMKSFVPLRWQMIVSRLL